MNNFSSHNEAKEEDMCLFEHTSKDQRGSSDAPCMWRVVRQLIIAGHLHEPWVSLARFTSKIDSLKRNASSIA
jgi:hypothetical protein